MSAARSAFPLLSNRFSQTTDRAVGLVARGGESGVLDEGRVHGAGTAGVSVAVGGGPGRAPPAAVMVAQALARRSRRTIARLMCFMSGALRK